MTIEARPIPGKGLGVIANSAIGIGDLIETAPAPEFSAAIRDILSISALGGMEFVDPETYDPRPGAPNKGRFVLGLASICNHSDKPNARVIWQKVDGQEYLWAQLYAVKDIPAGAEVTIYYTDIAAYNREGWAA